MSYRVDGEKKTLRRCWKQYCHRFRGQ